MTNGTASETNGIKSPIPCPYCGCEMRVEVYTYLGLWFRVVPTENHREGCFLRGVQHRRFSSEESAIEAWNTRVAVTDRDFAMAVHDGRTWVCVEGALESDALKPIEGFTRDSIYRDSMAEYGEWMEKAVELMRDLWSGFECGVAKVCDACPSGAKLGDTPCAIEERLQELGIEAD